MFFGVAIGKASAYNSIQKAGHGMNYKINATADFDFNGVSYHAIDFENTNLRTVEVYDHYDNGMERFRGYAADLGLVGTLAKLALGQFEVQTLRRSSDDGICCLKSANFIADLEPDTTSGSLRVCVVEDGSGHAVCTHEGFGSIDSVRTYLGELEIERLNGAVSALN